MKTRFNKLTAWVLTLAMMMTFMPSFTLGVSAADDWTYPTSTPILTWSGNGEERDPYIIGTAQELADFAYMINNVYDYRGKYYVLGDDIDLGNQEWTPIGLGTGKNDTTISYFRGHFDGKEHSIYNLKISKATNSYVGLFGAIEVATIQNLTVASGSVSHNSDSSTSVGGIVGYARHGGDIINCKNNATVSNTGSGSYKRTGGIVGRSTHANANPSYGSLVGVNISNCENTGAVTGSTTSANGFAYTGGIVGGLKSANVIGCTNSGTINGSGSSQNWASTGGIVGTVDVGSVAFTISECANTGNVTGNCGKSDDIGSPVEGTGGTGGIVGRANRNNDGGTISKCYNTGTITDNGTSPRNGAGGIAGSINCTKQYIEDCYNAGTITTGGNGSIAGGIVAGVSVGNIKNCHNYGSVTGVSTSKYGTAIGYNGGSNTTVDNVSYLGYHTAEEFADRTVLAFLNGERSIWKQGSKYPLFNTYTVTASVSPAGGGNVTGNGTYDEGTEATLSATANDGYLFKEWTENRTVVSTDANYTFDVLGNRDLVAVFEDSSGVTKYTISVAASPENYGTVTGGGTYSENSSVTVTATANTGYQFVQWTENTTEVSTDASYTFPAGANRNLVAVFEEIPVASKIFTVTFNANGGAVTPESVETGEDGKLTALPTPIYEGYTFNGWFDAATGGNAITTENVYSGNTTIYAQWTQIEPVAEWGTAVDNITGRGTLNQALRAAETNNSIAYVRLLDGVSVSGLEINGGEFTFDMNTKTITTTASLWINAGKIKFKNGGIESSSNYVIEMEGNNTEVVLDSGTYQSTYVAVVAREGTKLTLNADAEVIGGEFGISTSVPVVINGAAISGSVADVTLNGAVNHKITSGIYDIDFNVKENGRLDMSEHLNPTNTTFISISDATDPSNPGIGGFGDGGTQSGESYRLTSTATNQTGRAMLVGLITLPNYYGLFDEEGTLHTSADASDPYQGKLTVKEIKYTISFDANGGNCGTASAETVVGKLAELPTPTLKGHKFDGWFDAKEGGNAVTTDKVYTANTTIYAHWTEKQDVSITETAQTFMYGETAKTFVIDGNVTENFTVIYQQNSQEVTPKNAGVYDVIITRAEDDTYKEFEKTLNAALKITPLPVNITWENTEGLVYDKTSKTINPVVANKVSGDTVNLTVEGTTVATEKGEYTATVIAVDNPNYTVTDGINLTKTWVIAEKPLNADCIADIVDVTFTGEEIKPTLEVKDVDTVLELGTDYDVVYQDNTNVGTAKAVVTFKGNYTGTAEKEFTILKKQIDSAITLTAPVKNTAPQTEILGDGYTAAVTWSPEVTDTFGYNTEYTATITINVDENHTVTGIAANGYIVEGAKTVTNEENSNVITVAYEKTGSRPSSGGGTTRYTVKFDTDGGSNVASKTVARNGKVAEPTAPTKEGFTFDGWYTDKELTKAYDFETKVTKAITLYAKWDKHDDETDKPSTSDKDCNGTATDNCPSLNFDDLDVKAWYHLDADYVIENGIFKGVSETEFAPNDKLTRAMLVTVLYRVEGEPATNRSIPFADVDMGAYYGNAVSWAKQNGIVNGVSETEFAPNDNITREQIAAIMHRYAAFKGYDVSVGENTNILSYEDFDSISEYAIASMQYACGSGLMKGKSESTLNPLDNATRAEIAAILHRFIEANK